MLSDLQSVAFKKSGSPTVAMVTYLCPFSKFSLSDKVVNVVRTLRFSWRSGKSLNTSNVIDVETIDTNCGKSRHIILDCSRFSLLFISYFISIFALPAQIN